MTAIHRNCLHSVGAWSGWQGLQICNILQWPDLFCNQDLQLEACADWCSWAAFGQRVGVV